jgi:LCP family protein required for cell wall assembly
MNWWKGVTIIQEIQSIPGATERNPQSSTQSQPPGLSRRRRIGIALAFLMTVAVVALGIQTWRVIDAITNAESAAVVDLPPTDPDILLGGALQTTSTPPSAPTIPADAPSATTQSDTAELVATEAPTKVPTVVSTATTTPTVTDAATATMEADSPSRLEVLRKIVAAGMEGGDPGRSTVWEGKTDLNILVLGVDRRADGGDQNADVIIIAHLDLIQKKLAAVSIPRDLLVDIPDVGPDKINGSYNYGVLANADDPVAGVIKVRDTIEYVFGIPIDAYTLLDFDGFRDVIDAAGGVEVDVQEPIHDEEYPTEDYGTKTVEFSVGQQEMDGERALEYVRTRHGNSDDARRDRQRQVLLALFEKGKELKSATRADNVILALGDSIQTSFPLEQQLTLARLAYEMEETEITITALGQPILQEGATPDGRWAYVGDMNEIVTFVQSAIEIPDAPSDGT